MTIDTLDTHVTRFINLKNSPHTRKWYMTYLRPMIQFFGEECQLNSVKRVNAEAYWQSVQNRQICYEDHPYKKPEERKLSPTTLENYLRAARTFWNKMVAQKEVEYNPFDHIEATKDDCPVEMKAITPDDLRAIWKAARTSGPRDFAIVTIMATSGVRAGELVSMDIKRMNLNRGEIWVNGKRGWRKIFLGKTSKQVIRDYLEDRPNAVTSSLWLNQYRESLTEDGVRQLFNRLAERAGIKGKHNPHAFRHRVAQAWLDSGINAEIVAQALGHANVTVTLTIYGNQDHKRLRTTMNRAELVPFHDPYEGEELEESSIGWCHGLFASVELVKR
ncbi:MAG: tyrosine-type recombinase/integrase [Chloroflexota bacterium]